MKLIRTCFATLMVAGIAACSGSSVTGPQSSLGTSSAFDGSSADSTVSALQGGTLGSGG
jgi:hypothetical protein